MKKNKCFHLLLITTFFIFNTAFLPVFAAYADGHTNVKARIENVHEEMETTGLENVISGDETSEKTDSQSVNTGDKTSEKTDSQSVNTGDNSTTKIWIVLLLTSGCAGCGVALYNRKKRILK